MLISNDTLMKELKEFNRYLKDIKKPDKLSIREIISQSGRFIKTKDTDIHDKVLSAVDGSNINFGGTYPYILSLSQAYSYILPKSKNIALSRVFSPLIPKDMEIIENEKSETPTMEMAAQKAALKVMAGLEMEVAVKTALEIKPFLIMLDGGFVQYRIKAPDKWEKFKNICLNEGILIVGVIEEVSTHMISDVSSGEFTSNLYDREIFYGTLDRGEYFLADPDICTKEGIITAFARFSNEMQAISCDFLYEQRNRIELVMDMLAAMTPKHGRGIPLLIDLVDRAVRLKYPEVERLIDVALDPVFKDIYLTSQRERRNL